MTNAGMCSETIASYTMINITTKPSRRAANSMARLLGLSRLKNTRDEGINFGSAA